MGKMNGKHKAAEKNELWKCFGLRWLGTSPISLVVVGLADHFGSFHTIYHMQCSIRSGPTRESNSALEAHRCMIVAHITCLMPDPRGIMGDKWCHCLSLWAVADCLSISRTNLLLWDVILHGLLLCLRQEESLEWDRSVWYWEDLDQWASTRLTEKSQGRVFF